MNQPQRLSQSVWRLGCYHSTCYLVRGSRASALFEAGITAIAPLVLDQLDALEVPRREIRHLIISHAHADHASGQAALMAGLPRATLLLTKASADFLARPKTRALFAAENAFTSGEVARRDGLARLGQPPAPETLLPDPWSLLSVDEEIDLGGISLTFLTDRGHAPGGLVAHVPQEKVVLAGDSAGLATPRGPHFPLFFVSYAGYQETLAAIVALAPRALGLGHQTTYQGPAVGDYLARTAEHLAAEREELRRGRAQGKTEDELAQGLFERYYEGELTVYSAEGIMNCCRLLVRRGLED